MPSEIQQPKVGVGVMVLKDGKVLLGKRKGSHGEGEFALPGGHLEYMESFADCVNRELREECGITVKNIRFLLVANIVKYAPKHYVNVCFLTDWQSGEPRVLEPEKFQSVEWYEFDKLPSPLFFASKLVIENYKSGRNYFDIKDL